MNDEITEDDVHESLSEFEDQNRFSLIRTILTQQRDLCRLAGKLNTKITENKRQLFVIGETAIQRDKLQSQLDNKKIDADILYRWLEKAYELGLKRDRFDANITEMDYPILDLDYTPNMKKELEKALKGNST